MLTRNLFLIAKLLAMYKILIQFLFSLETADMMTD